MKKALQVVGALSLVAWTALGLLAWSKVEGNVTLRLEEGDARDEEVALLDDRMAALSGDLGALVASLETNFGVLAGSMDARDVAAARAQARTEERLRALEAALPAALSARETAGALSAALDRLESLEARSALAALEVARAEPPAEEAAPAPEAEPETSALAAAVEELAAEPDPPAAVPDEPEPPARSFLAFRLPSREFAFEGPQAFEVLGDLSRVGFDAKSTLHDFTGVSEHVSGSFRVDLAHPEDGIEGRVEIASSSLVTGLEGRDEAMLEHLATGEYPRIAFEASALEAGSVDPDARTLEGVLRGRLTVHGETRDVAMDVSAHVDESRRLVVEGEMPLLLSDYGVPTPSKLGVISMDDGVRVWIHLRARAKPGAVSQ